MKALLFIAISIVLAMALFTAACAISYLLHHGDTDERRDYDED